MSTIKRCNKAVGYYLYSNRDVSNYKYIIKDVISVLDQNIFIAFSFNLFGKRDDSSISDILHIDVEGCFYDKLELLLKCTLNILYSYVF